MNAEVKHHIGEESELEGDQQGDQHNAAGQKTQELFHRVISFPGRCPHFCSVCYTQGIMDLPANAKIYKKPPPEVGSRGGPLRLAQGDQPF
ncbi:hypothetical protein K370107A2_05480 [Merdimmobilis hominis]